MRTNASVTSDQIRTVYDGVQRELYEIFMGRQIHVGGLRSSLDLAEAAHVSAGLDGVELCCGTGASMRMVVRLFDVRSMTGVELASAPVEHGRAAVDAAGLTDRVTLVVGDATHTELPSGATDFVWGEDAWCYVPDKAALIAEAHRLLRPGGRIAFTDWIEGPTALGTDEAEHLMQLMTFPSLASLDDYRELLGSHDFDVEHAEDTGRFGDSFALYAQMIESQFTFDALELLGFERAILDVVIEQLHGLSRLGHDGKLIQARFVARKR